MISKADLDVLMNHKSQTGSLVLSVYLNVDQSQAANLNHGFEKRLKGMLRSIEEQIQDRSQQQEFANDAEQILSFISTYLPQARSIVIFGDASEEFLWWRELEIDLGDDTHWSETPYVRPLLEALERFERYGVILADRKQARLFTMFMGEIEEHRQALASDEVQRTKTTGKDQTWSAQTRFQRRAEMAARSHLKQVAELADKLTHRHGFDRLILAGNRETLGELYRLLPRRLQSRVVDTISLPVEADPQEVLAATLDIEQEVERAYKHDLVEALITAANKQEGAVTGLNATLSALQEGSVWQLVYTEGLDAAGWQCPNCLALFAEEQQRCPYCNTPLQATADMIGLMAERVFEAGGKVELVPDNEAAAQLQTAGGIGAYLRY